LIHRDLKPGNLMVTPDGRPVILDFGLAAEAEDGTGSSGTPAYMAPEQLQQGPERPDRRTDVHALGAILYECLTLHRSFEQPSLEALGRAVLSGATPSPRCLRREVPRALDTLVRVALAFRQDERYQTALDLAEDLRRFGAGEAILARRPSWLARAGREIQRRPLLTLGWASIVAALGLGTVFALGQYARNREALAATERWTDQRVLTALEQEADAGWPRLPASVPALDAWLQEAQALQARAAATEASSTAAPGALDGASEPQELGPRLAHLARRTEDVRTRRAEAAELAERTIEAYAGRWKQALATIADEEQCPKYEGLRIVPQVGLVPLGRDENSLLYEFHHVQSGSAEPVLEARSWRVGLDTGLVLVLLPGGRFSMGAEPPGPGRALGAPNVDPDAQPDEGPIHEVELAPFFLSKYEMTRAQWLRTAGALPPQGGDPADLLLPVGATHEEAEEVLALFGLTLATEAQWEYAARGGKTSPWWWGESAEQFDDQEVLARSPRRVGTHSKNGFGFFDMLGNAGEMVLDAYAPYTLPVREGDGLRLVEGVSFRVGRGVAGSSASSFADIREARCASRKTHGGTPRPARALDGEWTKRRP
jgi:formylglycine-generating enzyme required for sulfatase activity